VLGSGQSTVNPYVKHSVTDRRDLNNAAINTTTTDAAIDDYGNPTSQTQQVTGGGKTFSTTTTTAYKAYAAATWLNSLPSSSVVTKVRDSVSVTRTSSADYDGNGLPATQTTEPGNTALQVITTIDRSGNPYGLAKKNTQTWRDPATATDVSRAPQEVIAFDAKGRFPTQVKNALGHTESYQYDPRFGAKTQLVNANLVTTNWTIDGFGRATSEFPPDGTEHRQFLKQCTANCPAWATHVHVSELFGTDGNQYAAPTLVYLDDGDRSLRTETTGLNGKQIYIDQRYDALGRPIEVDQPRFSDAAAVLASSTTYDALNRVATVTTFDDANVARTTTTGYNGLSTTVTNPKNQQIVNVNDALGQLAQATDAQAGVTTYLREPFGNLRQVTDPLGNVVTISYDTLGRRTDLRDPDLGWVHYDTDPVGRGWRQQSPKQRSAGQYTTTAFDLLDRMTARVETDLNSVWVYDTATKGTGQLAEAYTNLPAAPTVKDYRRVHTYDSLGRLSTTTTTLDTSYVSTTSYDAVGRVSQTSHQRSGSALKAYDYSYSSLGPLLSISRAGTPLWQAGEADAAQRTTYALFGNGLAERQTFNPYSGRLTAALVDAAGTARLAEGYTYDELGNVTQRAQTWDGAGFTENFTYDSMNRLASAQVGTAAKAYQYNAIGNMTSKTGVGTGAYVYPASGAGSAQPHAVQSIPGLGNYGYDINGNLISAPNGATLTWKSFDMPDTLSRGGMSDQFVYGPEHQRARQNRSDGTALYYAGAMEVEVKAGVTTLKTYWPTGLGVEIDKTNVATELLWTHTDRLGSVIGLTNSAGTFKEKLGYDAWGKRRTTDASATPDTLDGQADNKGFTGHEMLDNIDMVHMNGRIYEPNIARFVSADPIIQDPEHSQSYNRYAYVWNNPTNLTDPTGFMTDDKRVGSGLSNEVESAALQITKHRDWDSIAIGATTTTATLTVQMSDGSQQVAKMSFNSNSLGFVSQVPGGVEAAAGAGAGVAAAAAKGALAKGESTSSGSNGVLIAGPGGPEYLSSSCADNECFGARGQGGGVPSPGAVQAQASNNLAVALDKSAAHVADVVGYIFKSDSVKLARNMVQDTDLQRDPGQHAHHIVAANDLRAAPGRLILNSVKMDVNSAFNGIFLDSSQHARIHTNVYYNAVNAALVGAKTYDDVAFRLTVMRAAIQAGTFPR